MDNYKAITLIKNDISTSGNNKLIKRVNKLYSTYHSGLSKISISLLDQNISHINSYLNQTRYGLARLYDNTVGKE